MIKEIFQRVEVKYLINEEQYKRLMELISDKIKKSEYYKSTICNIYYDTSNYQLIRHAIEKPIYKEKIRLRSYGVPKLDSKVFLEIKRKYNGVVSKRRITTDLNEFYKYKRKHQISNVNKQILTEIDYYFLLYDLEEKIYIGYEREAYVAKENEELRITFDYNLRYRNNNLYLEKGDYGTPYFNERKYLVEIKTLNSIPIWLSNVLTSLDIYPISFSKYGNIYKKLLKCS